MDWSLPLKTTNSVLTNVLPLKKHRALSLHALILGGRCNLGEVVQIQDADIAICNSHLWSRCRTGYSI